MPRHTIIGCAYFKEAKPLIEHFSLKQTAPTLWEGETIDLILLGLGRASAAAAVERHGRTNALFLNVGVCGHKTHPVGSLFLIHKLHDSFHTFYPQILHKTSFQSASLTTVDTPTYAGDTLYDMEGTAFFQTALHFSPLEYIHCVKIISDTETTPFDPKRVPSLMHMTLPLIEELREMVPHLEEGPDISTEYERLTQKYHFTATEKHTLKDQLEKKALFEREIRRLPV